MAKGRKAVIKEPIKETPKEVKRSAWTVDVKLKKSLMTPYRISGRVDDIVSVPADLIDELVRLKKVEKV
jgi:hypothetical protein